MARILVVDDDPDTRQLLYLTLRRAGYDAEAADSVDAALAFLDQQPFDLIVLDLMMPRRSGFDLLRALKLRRDPLPVVVLSAKSNLADRAEALSLGAVAYLVKPATPAQLLAAISRALRGKEGDHGNRSL